MTSNLGIFEFEVQTELCFIGEKMSDVLLVEFVFELVVVDVTELIPDSTSHMILYDGNRDKVL